MDDGEDEVPNAMDDNEDEVPNAMDDSEDEVPNAMDESEDEDPNENNGIIDEVPIDSEDENDGLSDVNEDNIVEEEVIDYPVMGIPFMHVMACITKKRDNVEDYIDDYLKKPAYLRTYCNNFPVIPDENLWLNGNFKTVLPPIRKRGVGMPKLSRKKGSNEPNKVQRSVGFRCGTCKEVGHNYRTCKNKSHPKVGSSSTTDAAGNATATGTAGNDITTGAAENGTETTAASPRIPGTVTRVLWFPSRHERTSTQPPTPLTQGAPQPSQHSQP
ncbi:hypothetical protein QYF36_006500 [Acer negundo]|nr:hypothetical protein QYF36_006500 [Acer negundo]